MNYCSRNIKGINRVKKLTVKTLGDYIKIFLQVSLEIIFIVENLNIMIIQYLRLLDLIKVLL